LHAEQKSDRYYLRKSITHHIDKSFNLAVLFCVYSCCTLAIVRQLFIFCFLTVTRETCALKVVQGFGDIIKTENTFCVIEIVLLWYCYVW